MDEKKLITGSIVIYKNSKEDVKNVVKSFFNNELNLKLYISDNSPDRNIEEIFSDSRIEYIKNDYNLGFGKGHNIAIKKAMEEGSNYHVLLNPDVYFKDDVINKLIDFMDGNPDIGMVTPKIKFPNGKNQNSCKLLPTPFDLFQRRFLYPFNWIKKLNSKYEMSFAMNDQIIESPNLSGCFMFIRTEILKKVGLFDENIFLYSEDIDLTRRINKEYRTVMYTKVEIFHKWERGSYKEKRLCFEQIKSSIYYFNKYGWFFDMDRKRINKRILKKYLKVVKK